MRTPQPHRRTDARTRRYARMRTHAHTHTRARARAHTHTQSHTHTHSHTVTHTHTRARARTHQARWNRFPANRFAKRREELAVVPKHRVDIIGFASFERLSHRCPLSPDVYGENPAWAAPNVVDRPARERAWCATRESIESHDMTRVLRPERGRKDPWHGTANDAQTPACSPEPCGPHCTFRPILKLDRHELSRELIALDNEKLRYCRLVAWEHPHLRKEPQRRCLSTGTSAAR